MSISLPRKKGIEAEIQDIQDFQDSKSLNHEDGFKIALRRGIVAGTTNLFPCKDATSHSD
jgi:hypothetical protein